MGLVDDADSAAHRPRVDRQQTFSVIRPGPVRRDRVPPHRLAMPPRHGPRSKAAGLERDTDSTPPWRSAVRTGQTRRPDGLWKRTRTFLQGSRSLWPTGGQPGQRCCHRISQKHPHIFSQWSRDWLPKQGRPPSRRERVRSVDCCFSMLVHTFTRWGNPLPAGYRTASSRSRDRPDRRSGWHHPRTIRQPPRTAGRAQQGAADEIPWCPQCRQAGW